MWSCSELVIPALFVCWLSPPGACGDDTPQEPLAFVEEYRALRKEAEVKLKPIRDRAEKDFKSATSEIDRDRIRENIRSESDEILSGTTQKVFDLVKPHAADRNAVEPLVWVARSRSRAEIGHAAAELLMQHHLVSPETIDLSHSMRLSGGRWVEPMLRAQLAENVAPPEQACRVMLALAKCLQWQADFSRRLKEATETDLQQLERDFGKNHIAKQSKADSDKLEKEAIRLFWDAAGKHPNLKTAPSEPTVAEIARSSVFEINFLAIGKQAPEIEGEDLDGSTFQLSGYRGKVVMLSYWATWCAPCMGLIPQERALVELYKDKPFVLIGVNADRDKEKLGPVLKEYKISWRSFWCGPKGPEGLIATSWNVNSWPTIFLIDQAGIIRGKNLNGAALDAKIAALVSEAERAPRTTNP